MTKLNLGIIFGGKSAEHEISLISAKNIIDNADKNKYEIYPIGINKNGEFLLFSGNDYILDAQDAKKVRLNNNSTPITFNFNGNQEIIGILDKNLKIKLDVVFPVLHGTFGEDGTIQGLFEMTGIPYVGANVLGSAIGMDKEIAKKILENSGIKTAKFLTFFSLEKQSINFSDISSKLGLPFFIKPASAGSSVGIHKIKDDKDFSEKINDAFKYSNKIICEETIVGKEIECSVLGNENPMASLPGEVIPNHEFYSYEAKYLDENGAKFEIPTKLPESIIKNIQEIAIKSFKVLGCEGMARVDGFLKENNEFILNEINTIPGFTTISMYPKLWEVSGVSYSELIDKLIQLAIERYNREKVIKTSYIPS
jgi:D-alanine-D-alanine ligase